jgi:predicted permease
VLLLSVAGVVLLIASLNVANMMLARGAARRKEIAIRLALGGGRRSILQQLFTEGLLLALLGGATGLVVAYWSTNLLVASISRLAPMDVAYAAGPDSRVLLATMAFCALSTVLFGLGPAWNLSRQNVNSTLKDGDHESDSKPRRWFSRRNLLVMSQVSLSLVLLTTAGLFIRSAMRAADVEPGFQLDREIVAELDPSLAGYDQSRGRQVYAALLDRVSALPGVESASLAASVPFGMVSFGRQVEPAEQHQKNPLNARYNLVSHGYFATLSIPLLRGRAFKPAEDLANAPAVVVIDKIAADKLWPGRDAIGQKLLAGSSDKKDERVFEVVGVVGNVQDHIYGTGPEPHIYIPMGVEYQADMNLHVKTASAGETALLDTVRREVRAVDDRLPLLSLRTLRGHLEASVDTWMVRTGARVLSIFGGVALLLAMIGLYGVRAYTVATRTREIGIRMALGAGRGEALGMILREGLIVTAIAAAVGLALSFGVGAMLSSFLYRVSGSDPIVFAGAPLLLTAVSLVACYIPARRAAKVDPMVALRHE